MRKITAMLLLCLLAIGQLFAQTRTVTGKVTDDKGAPVVGASVTVKGTNVGTTTDEAGAFSLDVPENAKTITVSSVNFTSQDIAVGSRTNFNVSLAPTDANLDEVVVVGYQNVQKKNLTGAVATVGNAEIKDRPVLSFDQALTGKAAGVFIGTSSGLIGDNVIIRVRGASSLGLSSQPLIIIDGIPIDQGDNGQLYNPSNALADINPNDIESVEVLKDAAAGALYGSRAAAGVLIITTKKGKAGQAKINYDGYMGYNEPGRNIEVMNSDNYTSTINRMRSNAGLGDIAKYGDIDGDGQLDVVSTDWQDEVYRNGFVQNHQISAQGGGAAATFYASLNYNDFNNYIINNQQKRVTARVNTTAKVAKWLTVGINSQFGRTQSFGLGSGTGGAASGIPLGPLLYFPNVPVYDADGNFYLGQGGNTFGMGVIPNPVAVLTANFDNRDARRFLGSAYAEAQIIKGLKLKTQFNTDLQTAYTDQFWNPEVGDGSGLNGVAQTVYDETRLWSWFNTLNYNTSFGENHTLDLLAGTEFTKRSGFWNYTFGIGLNDPDFTYLTPNNYGTVGAETGNYDANNNGLASYFGAINYGYKGKYLASVNFRADGFSGFGSDNRFGYFPSGSIAWRISQEDFMAGNKIFNDLKLRASYGYTGNSNVGSFASRASFSPTLYADIPALTLTNPGNTALQWERSGQLDIGLDATIFKNFDIVLDYYEKKTDQLILNNPVLATLGFPNNVITENIGQIESKGFEASLTSRNITKRNFSWTTNFNFAWNKNTVISTNDNNDDIFGGFGIARPGEELGSYFLIRYGGANPANGRPTFYTKDGVQVQYDPTTTVPAAQRWTTLDGRVVPAITASDRIVHEGKTPYPKYFGGLSNTFNFYNFDFSFDLQYAFDFYVYNSTISALSNFTTQRNKTTQLNDAWTTAGQVTNVPRLYWNDVQGQQASTRWLERGDFVRVRNMQLGYNIPKSLLSKVNIATCRFYWQVQNLYTFTDYTGIDPESNANGNTNIGLGVDNNRPYLPRTWTFGLQLGL